MNLEEQIRQEHDKIDTIAKKYGISKRLVRQIRQNTNGPLTVDKFRCSECGGIYYLKRRYSDSYCFHCWILNHQ